MARYVITPGQGSAWYLSDSTTLTKLVGQNFTGEIIEFY